MLLDLLRLSRAVGEASSGKLSGKLTHETPYRLLHLNNSVALWWMEVKCWCWQQTDRQTDGHHNNFDTFKWYAPLTTLSTTIDRPNSLPPDTLKPKPFSWFGRWLILIVLKQNFC